MRPQVFKLLKYRYFVLNYFCSKNLPIVRKIYSGSAKVRLSGFYGALSLLRSYSARIELFIFIDV